MGINEGAILEVNVSLSTLEVINNKLGRTYGCKFSLLASYLNNNNNNIYFNNWSQNHSL